MSSAICQNFVQNAWKKELCSNCFKSKEEHAERPKPKPIKLVSNDKVEGIIRNANKKKPKRSVAFTKELTKVIGYGGEDWESCDEDAEDINSTTSSEDDSTQGESDEELARELKRITKENTDFNTTNLSKLEEPVTKKVTAQLMLGKPLVDATGRKQTLLVSVTPFGEDSPHNRKVKPLSHIPISSKTNRESLTEATKVVLKSYTKNEPDGNSKEEKSLLEEITETLENGKNPIQIISRKKTQQEIVLAVPKSDTSKEHPALKQKVGLSRAPALKRDHEKPIYQTCTAKIELSLQLPTPSADKHPPGEAPEAIQSREQAGEPDGRADPDLVSEPPALPLSPPPQLDPPCLEKPKVPSKPATVLIRKPILHPHVEHKPPILLSTFAAAERSKEEPDAAIIGKRKAPRPPEDSSEAPALRQAERRDRAASCSPKLRNSVIGSEGPSLPAPAPRRVLSASSDSLAVGEEKRAKAKGRFSLKKFLRMGSSKELGKALGEPAGAAEAPLPKPRLVIVHPTELNGAKVEVVPANEALLYQNVQMAKYAPLNSEYENVAARAERPAPPPRHCDDAKPPQVPTAPKSSEVLSKQRQMGGFNARKAPETVYANIGEVRSAIVPNKPQRTASMREREAQQQRSAGNYDAIDASENVYDYVNNGGRSSSPESDSSRNKHSPIVKNVRLNNKRCESSIDISGEYFKFGNFPRSVSLTYCGSETESEIYSPYSFYGSESEITEDDHDWIQNGRTHKLRSRKGRSIVHKNLEDNYGAVIVANHEALAQVLENIQQSSYIQPALRGLKSLSNLRWTDFKVTSASPVTVGSRVFHQAIWNGQNVTLLVNTGAIPSSTLSFGSFTLTPITEFSDLIPTHCSNEPDKYDQATVGVLPWLSICTIQSYAESTKMKNAENQDEKDSIFIMLQLVNALKVLQAQGIEELPMSLNTFVLCKDMEKESQHKLYVLQGLGEDANGKRTPEPYGTLCMCASKATNLLQRSAKTTSLIQSVLNHERAVSLTQVKSILEFSLWGPSDVALSTTIRERELALQRWIDLQRATVLHGLVCTRVQLTVYEECHLLFLVRSNARMMSDASLLLESSNMKNSLASGNK